MPRRPKPFFHRGWWCRNVGGSRTKLAQGRENKDAAEDALLDLLNERRLHPDRKTYPQLTVRDLCDKFLDWVELHRAPDTYEDYHDGLTGWVKLHGDRRARDIHSLDLEEWKGKLVNKGAVQLHGEPRHHRREGLLELGGQAGAAPAPLEPTPAGPEARR